jgi:hypothetical protein
MQAEEHATRDENDVKESGGNMKCEKLKRPMNNQDRRGYPKRLCIFPFSIEPF